MIGAGLLARKRRRAGPHAQAVGQDVPRPRLAVVTEYLNKAGLTSDLDALGFNTVGYGCTTCIGNSGPLPDPIASRDQERRPRRRRGALGQPQLRGPRQPARARPTTSPARRSSSPTPRRHGRHRPHDRAARQGQGRQARLPEGHLADADRRSPTPIARRASRASSSRAQYANVFQGPPEWRGDRRADRRALPWDERSHLHPGAAVLRSDMPREPRPIQPITRRALPRVGRRLVTTDHISPAGSIKARLARRTYLQEHGVARRATSTATAPAAATTA